MSSPNTPDRSSRVRGSGCPLCGQPITPAFRPFCSRGCRDRDLLAWLGDAYRVPGRPADPEGREIDADGLDSDRDPHL